MLTIWKAEPARIVGLLTACVLGALVGFAPLDPGAKAALVGALVYLAHELVRSQVTPAVAPPVEPPGGAP